MVEAAGDVQVSLRELRRRVFVKRRVEVVHVGGLDGVGCASRALSWLRVKISVDIAALRAAGDLGPFWIEHGEIMHRRPWAPHVWARGRMAPR